jgi:arginine utilization regulatory protein
MSTENQKLIDLEEELLKLKLKVCEYEKKDSLLQNILEQIDEAIYAYDKAGRLIYMNGVSEKIEGQKRNMIIGKKETEIWDTNLAVPILQDKNDIENERMYYTISNGKRIHITHSMYPYFYNNEIMGCFSINKDVTQIGDMLMNIYELQQQLRTSKRTDIPINGTRFSLNDIIGDSQIMKKCVENAYKVSKHKSNILIYGETGTGKELFAQGIHNASSNHKEPFIAINCSAIPNNLLESLLFGTIKGSFTGALETKGLFEQAEEGTLFLDEVNSMPIDMQPKLLRVLQEKKYRRIGDTKDKNVRCRVLSSTNIEPAEAIKLGQLRQDLYYRIATVTITIPPLRERDSDAYLLIYYFMDKYNKTFNTKFESIDNRLMKACNNYNWPGNVRELEHMIESALNLSESYEKTLTLELFPILINNEAIHNQHQVSKLDYLSDIKKVDLNKEVDNYEMELIKNALVNNKGNITATARQLSIHRSVLYNKMKRLEIDLNDLRKYVLK